MGLGDRFRFGVEYALLRALIALLARLPEGPGERAGRALGRVLGALAPGRRRLAERNMALAFPEADPGLRARWSRGVWGWLGGALQRFARLSRLAPERFDRAVTVQGMDLLKESLASGRGALVFTAHFGDWEYVPAAIRRAGLPLAMIARRAKNPSVDEYITRLRERFGARVMPHRSAARESLRWLKEGKVLGLLFDQRITAGGLSVPFFGRPARTTGLPALVALRLGCPVHPILAVAESGRVTVRVEPALGLPAGGPTPENVAEATRRMTQVVETWVRRWPDRWLWIHDRWKP